jgi:hypothetical protein
MLIYFDDYQSDGMDKIVKATKAEWEALIAPAINGNHHIDSSTVDTAMFDLLYARPAIKTDADVKHVVPLV